MVIKTDVKNYNYFDSVFPSLDEGYTRILEDKLTYLPKSSDEVAFLSMLGEDEIKFPKFESNLNQSIAFRLIYYDQLSKTKFLYRLFIL